MKRNYSDPFISSNTSGGSLKFLGRVGKKKYGEIHASNPFKTDSFLVGPNNRNGIALDDGEITEKNGNTLRVASDELGTADAIRQYAPVWGLDKAFNFFYRQQEKLKNKLGITNKSNKITNNNLNNSQYNMSTGGEKLKRVDFEEWFKKEGNKGRPVNISAMNQLQDSLINRAYGLPQRLAILATAAQEMDKKGGASRGVGGNGYLGYSSSRMPVELLGDTPEQRGKQINFLLNDLGIIHSDNWLDGGSGGPYIATGKDGYDKFWNGTNVYETTRVLNKSNIRPRDREAAWNNRADVAKAMQKHMYKNGGQINNINSPSTGTQKRFATGGYNPILGTEVPEFTTPTWQKYKPTEEIGLGTDPLNWINLGVNTLGNIVTNIHNQRTLNRLQNPNVFIAQPMTKLKTRFNNNADLEYIADILGEQTGYNDRNTLSSQVANARNQRLIKYGLGLANRSNENKENIETQLINQDRLNQQNIISNNIGRFTNFYNAYNTFENNKKTAKTDSTNSMINGITDAFGNFEQQYAIRRRDKETLAQREQNDYRTLLATLFSYPDAAKALGINPLNLGERIRDEIGLKCGGSKTLKRRK